MPEPIPTRESLAGFVATESKLGTTRTGDSRLYVRVGVEHWQKEPDGAFTELPPSYHDMAAYGALAERLDGRFHKGDEFVAHGETRTYPSTRGGDNSMALEFVVRRIGHDIARNPLQRAAGPDGEPPHRPGHRPHRRAWRRHHGRSRRREHGCGQCQTSPHSRTPSCPPCTSPPAPTCPRRKLTGGEPS